MKVARYVGAFLVILAAGGAASGGEPRDCSPPASFPQRVAPAGGWAPYGGGLLHWWPRHCFPCAGAPDDYCRKPLPRVCWPPYPPYFIAGPAAACCPQCPERECFRRAR